MNQRLFAHLALFGANLIYAINYTVAKGLMPDVIGPSGFILLRVLGATLMFWTVLAFWKWEPIAKKDFVRLLICAGFGVAGNQLLFFNGLVLTSPISASIIMTSNPILVLVMAAWLIKESLNGRKVAGILLGAVGAIWLILQRESQAPDTPNPGLGNLLIFLNAASYGAYLVLVKPLMKKYRPITIISWVFLIGLAYVLPFGFQQFAEVEWGEIQSNEWLSLGFVVIGTTFLAYLLNIFALKRVPPTMVSMYIYLQPLLASLVALWVGSDLLNLPKIISAVLIFAGVYLVSIPKPRSKSQEQ